MEEVGTGGGGSEAPWMSAMPKEASISCGPGRSQLEQVFW